jgi:hypothetical protein
VEHAAREEHQLSERRHFVGRRNPEGSETSGSSSPRKTPHGCLSSWQGLDPFFESIARAKAYARLLLQGAGCLNWMRLVRPSD